VAVLASLRGILARLVAVLASLRGILARLVAVLASLRGILDDDLCLTFQMSHHDLVPFFFRVVNWLTLDTAERCFALYALPTPALPPSSERTRCVLESVAEPTLRIERLAADNRTSNEVQIRRWDGDLKKISCQCAQRQQRPPARDPAAGEQHPPTCWIGGALK